MAEAAPVMLKKEKWKEFESSVSNNMTIIIKRLPPIQELLVMLEKIEEMD